MGSFLVSRPTRAFPSPAGTDQAKAPGATSRPKKRVVCPLPGSDASTWAPIRKSRGVARPIFFWSPKSTPVARMATAAACRETPPSVPDRDLDAPAADGDVVDAYVADDVSSGRHGRVGQGIVELLPVHDAGERARVLVGQDRRERRDEADRPQLFDDRPAVEAEIVEDLLADDPRADDVGADPGFLFEDADVEAGGGQAPGRAQPARTGPDDDDISSLHS